jgi:hypothetical protein
VLISLSKNALTISNFKNFNFKHFWSLFCQLLELIHVQVATDFCDLVGTLDAPVSKLEYGSNHI